MSKGVADGYAEWLGAKPFAWSSDSRPTESETSPFEIATKPTHVYVGVPTEVERTKPKETVGIIGAGMSGLYAGLLLKEYNIPFRIFEGNTRIGGRVYTCRDGFEQEGKYQYFEAGAMRIPCIPSQQPLFELIEYLNTNPAPEKPELNLIEYYYKNDMGNLVYVNGQRMTLQEANDNPENLGFVGLKPEDKKKTADSLMDEVMQPLLEEFKQGKEKFFEKYDRMSLRYYLGSYESGPKWYAEKIDYVETMTSGSNAFIYGLVESVIEFDDFNSSPNNKWKTIDEGMSRLPEACAAEIGKQNITTGAIVYKITKLDDGKIKLTYSTDGQIPSQSQKSETFDKVLITISNAVLRMIERPRWSSIKEGAIRVSNVQPLYKIGLQFKTRFWEGNHPNPAYGGQSTTDTPSRWIVYPSYDLESSGKGILLTYSWSTDALSVLPASDKERRDIALRDLQEIYPNVNIRDQYLGCKSVHWAAEWGTGVADFLPGQFTQLFPALKKNEGNIYFAGEHISIRHGWIVGAMDSAGRACKQMFPRLVFTLPKKTTFTTTANANNN